MLRDRWSAVEALANALLKEKEMPWCRAYAIIAQALRGTASSGSAL